jgi:HAD superfamily hydrolase (TIGR01509 family)
VLASPLLEFRTECFRRLLCDRLGLGFEMSSAELDLEFWRAALLTRPEPHIGEALEAARSLRLPMGVVSNISVSAGVVEDDLERLGLMQSFRFVAASADYGVRKPHTSLFLAAAGRLGVEPAHVWFMGDSLHKDVAGARAAGMVGVWYNPSGLDAHEVTPDASVSDWAEFPALLERSLEDRREA